MFEVTSFWCSIKCKNSIKEISEPHENYIFRQRKRGRKRKGRKGGETTELKLNMCGRARHSINGLEYIHSVELVANGKRQTSMSVSEDDRWRLERERCGGQFPELKRNPKPKKTALEALEDKSVKGKSSTTQKEARPDWNGLSRQAGWQDGRTEEHDSSAYSEMEMGRVLIGAWQE